MSDLERLSPEPDSAAAGTAADPPSSDPRPPKQRFKETAQGSPTAPRQPQPHLQPRADKRPLSEILDAAEQQIVEAAEGSDPGSSPCGGGSPGEGRRRSGKGTSAERRSAAKQPRQVDSLIRNIARPHKPRIGPEYQAVLPPFNPGAAR